LHDRSDYKPSYILEKEWEADMNAMLEKRAGDTPLGGFVANDAVAEKPSSDAVRRLEVDTDLSHDARAVLERNQAIHKGLKDGSLEKGIYRGMGAYKQYAERSESAISNMKVSGQLGPARGITNVRSCLRIEYIGTTGEGGICKDYKDKKRRRWERRLKRKKAAGGLAGVSDESSDSDADRSSAEGSDDDELPQVCAECKTRWEECKSVPVRTQCGHYFCEDCALGNFATNPACSVCGAPTNGIFNSCDALEEKVKAKKALAKKNKKGASGSRLYGNSLED